MKNYYIKNIRIIDYKRDQIGNILIENGKISLKNKNVKNFIEIDGTGKIIMPGFFDPHVHFRQPGLEHKENFRTGSFAAVSSGVTSFFDMPNTIPATFTVELLEQKRKLAQANSLANFGLYFGAGMDNLDEIKKAQNIAGIKLYLNATTGNLKMDNENKWREIFHTGKKISLHAEGKTFFRAVEIWKEEGFPCELHLCHASLSSEINLVRNIKKIPQAKKKITVEVCPHHLFLTDKERKKYGAICCMKPDLATKEDLKAMWNGIADGTIDFFATDHAPHTWKEKEKGALGIPGVETFLPLLFTEFIKRNWDLKKLSQMTSQNVVKKFHIQNKKGQIKEGFDADLVLIDPSYKGKINPEKFFSKSKWSPFNNFEILCRIEKTIVNGQLVFDNGIINDKVQGKELILSAPC
jgi:dihydroorotase